MGLALRSGICTLLPERGRFPRDSRGGETMRPELDKRTGAARRPPFVRAGGFPEVRMRRNRKSPWSRKLVAENALTAADLIWPMFVIEGRNQRVPVASMPGIERLSVDQVVAASEEAVSLGIPAVALFPYTDPALRTPDGREALNSDNLVCHSRGGPRRRRAARRRARSLHESRTRRAARGRRHPQ
jgi:hypothetical protein